MNGVITKQIILERHKVLKLRYSVASYLSLGIFRRIIFFSCLQYLVLLALLIISGLSYSQDKKAFKAPRIDSYSKTAFSVYRGEKIRLKIEAQGPDLQFKWIRTSGTLCTTADCTVDTDQWGFGRHRVVFLVFNQYGSLFLTYHISILSPPFGYKPGEIDVPMVADPKEVEVVSVKDAVVSAVKGSGYAFHGSKVQVIGREERALEWAETLRAQNEGVLRFGRKDKESHVLFDGGIAHLSQSTPMRRAVILGRGSLRSRQIDGASPSWSILVADGSHQDGTRVPEESWLQVDLDAKGDVAIIREDSGSDAGIDGKQGAPQSKAKKGASEDTSGDESSSQSGEPSESKGVSIQVYGGTARVFLQTGTFGEGQAWVVPAGFEIEINKPGFNEIRKSKVSPSKKGGDTKSVDGATVLPLRIRKLNRVLKESSPEYRFGTDYDSSLNGWVLVPKSDRSQTLRGALLAATKELKKNEFFRALEELSPYWSSDRDDATLCALAAEAYSRLGWFDQVLKVFDDSRPKQSQVKPKTLIHLGIADLLESRWMQAYESFRLAKESFDQGLFGGTVDPYEAGLLDYYLGYAAFKAKEFSAAQKAMVRVAENSHIPGYIRDSSKGLRREATNQRLWDLGLGAGFVYDSNVLRSDQAVINFADSKFKKLSSMGITTVAHASAWAFRNHEGQFGAIFNLKRVDYLEPTMKAVAPLDQEIGIDTLLRFGLEETTKEAWFETGLKAMVGMMYVGDERALDYIDASFKVGSPKLMNLNFEILSSLKLDPLPLRDDFYDPELQELVGASDRSHRSRKISLGLEPYRSNSIVLGLKGIGRTGTYRAIDSKIDDFKGQGYQLYGDYKLPRQLSTGFSIDQTKVDFKNRDPVKSHKILSAKLNLGIMDLWTLNHQVGLITIKRESTYEAYSYKRNLIEYILNLDF